jgi:hypothetical protein
MKDQIILPDIFVMTLQARDLAASLSPADGGQIHIPIEARNALPGFWGWPDQFSPVKNAQQTNFRTRSLTVELPDGKKYHSKLVGNSTPWEFGLFLEAASKPLGLRKAGELLVIVLGPNSGADFLLGVVRRNEPFHPQLLDRCQKRLKASGGHRRFGYMDRHFNPCMPRERLWVVIQDREGGPLYKVFKQESQAIDECKAVERSNGRAKVISILEEV